jgi:hypothetical protein
MELCKELMNDFSHHQLSFFFLHSIFALDLKLVILIPEVMK